MNTLLKMLILIVLVFSSSCRDVKESDDNVFIDARIDSHKFVEIPFEGLPSTRPYIDYSDTYRNPMDADSIEMWTYRGGNYYHPTNLAQDCQKYIATYYHTNEIKYLRRAEKTAEKIMSECFVSDGIPFGALRFRYAVHSDSNYTFPAPWVSGMTQGEMLKVMCRLYEFTDNRKYLNYADSLFKAFFVLKRPDGPWFARIDKENYYWIEEYPHNIHPGMTLNGFNSAVFGLYDYYRVTKKPEVKKIYDMALTTLKHYLPRFRKPGGLSLYCIGHDKTTNLAYHRLHIRQMQYLHKITGDPFFKIMADIFRTDMDNIDTD
jgi:hypothetical protein